MQMSLLKKSFFKGNPIIFSIGKVFNRLGWVLNWAAESACRDLANMETQENTIGKAANNWWRELLIVLLVLHLFVYSQQFWEFEHGSKDSVDYTTTLILSSVVQGLYNFIGDSSCFGS